MADYPWEQNIRRTSTPTYNPGNTFRNLIQGGGVRDSSGQNVPRVGVTSLGEMSRVASANPGSPYANRVAALEAQGQMQGLGGGGVGGMSAQDMWMALLNGTNSGGSPSGGSPRGGGGGGPAPLDPAVKAAYMQMWQDAQNPGTNPYDAYEASLQQAYSNVPVNQRWDATGQAVQGATAAGSDRLAGILQELNSRAAQGRTDVSQAVAQGGAALQGIGNQAMQRSQGLAQGLTGGLGAFGAGAVQDTASSSLNNLAAAGQMYNQMLGNSYDAMAADRPVVYAGLGGDIREGMTRDQAALENAIAMQRAKETQANDLALAQAMGQSGLQRAQMEAQRQQEMNKLRLEMAQLGIEV